VRFVDICWSGRGIGGTPARGKFLADGSARGQHRVSQIVPGGVERLLADFPEEATGPELPLTLFERGDLGVAGLR